MRWWLAYLTGLISMYGRLCLLRGLLTVAIVAVGIICGQGYVSWGMIISCHVEVADFRGVLAATRVVLVVDRVGLDGL